MVEAAVLVGRFNGQYVARVHHDANRRLIAFVIAAPVSWYGMNIWLHDFAYRTTITWWMFAIAGIAAVVIAFATISFQAIKAALMNPVKSLRSE